MIRRWCYLHNLVVEASVGEGQARGVRGRRRVLRGALRPAALVGHLWKTNNILVKACF